MYEKEREGDKVRSRYAGKGQIAYLLHQLNLLRKEEAEFEKLHNTSQMTLELENEAKIEAAVELICEAGEMLTTAFFLTSGFHQHKRQWRKKRTVPKD